MISKSVIVVAVFILSVMGLCLGTAMAQPAPPYFIDDFEDGSAHDGIPVTWLPQNPKPGEGRSVEMGSYILSPGPSTFVMSDRADERIFDQVTVQTQMRFLGPPDTFSTIGLFARGNRYTVDNTFYWNGYWANVTNTGFLRLGRTLGGNIQVLSQSVFSPVPITEDVNLEFELLGSSLQVRAWSESMPRPVDPQLVAFDGIVTQGEVGISLESSDNLAPGAFRYFKAGSTRCDFDADAHCDMADLNALLSEGPVASGIAVTPGENDQFDLNGDGFIDNADVDEWLADAATSNGFGSPYNRGDSNLDGSVDVSDFNLWNENKFTNTLLWDSGNYNGDAFVDVPDFNLWNENKFTSSVVSSVPEPVSFALVLAGLLGVPVMRRRQTSSR